MSKERLIWQGQKQEKAQEVQRLKTVITGLVNGIRMELNPHAIEEINGDLVSQQGFDLADKLIRLRQLEEEIQAINKSLGLS